MINPFGKKAARNRECRRLREELESIDIMRAYCNAREPKIIAQLKQIAVADIDEITCKRRS